MGIKLDTQTEFWDRFLIVKCTIKQEIDMKIQYIFLCLLISIGLAVACSAEVLKPGSDTSIEFSESLQKDSTPEPTVGSSQDKKKNFHLEIGGNNNWLNNDYGQWKAFDVGLKYSGFQTFSPFGSISRQTRNEGSQFAYGLGSYIYTSSKSYFIAGISGAPVRDPDVVLYPRLRLDLSGYFNAPMMDGLVLSTGVTHFPKQNGGGGDIFSLGGIYYGKVILIGSMSYNIAQPGSVSSFSGQGGFMYGTQGKYWVGGGIETGRVAYQTVSEIPFDVRYESRGAHLFYSHWLGKNWGINTRYDYQNLVGAYRLNGITVKLFFDF